MKNSFLRTIPFIIAFSLTPTVSAQDFSGIIKEIGAIEQRLTKLITAETAQRKQADAAVLQKTGSVGATTTMTVPDTAAETAIRDLDSRLDDYTATLDSISRRISVLSGKVDSLSSGTRPSGDDRVREMAAMLKSLIGELKRTIAAYKPAMTATAASDGKSNEFKPAFEIGGQIYAHLSRDVSETRSLDNDGFSIERAYFDLKTSITPDIRGRLTLDLNPKDSTTKYMFLKYAFIEYGLLSNTLLLRAGQIETPWTGCVDKAWKYRSVEKSSSDLYKLLTSADLGAAVVYKLPGKYGEVVAELLNGNGIKNIKAMEETNILKDFAARLSMVPLPKNDYCKKLSINGGFQYKNDEKKPSAITTGLVAYEYGLLSLGAEVISATKKDTISGNQKLCAKGVSVFGDLSMWFCRNAGIMARYDRFDPDDKVAEDGRSLFMIGSRYKIMDQHTILLVYQHATIEKQGSKPVDLLKLVLEAKF